jgi:hypothetical protein
LILGYTVQTVDSDSPIGERYYFGGFFGVALLAAVGWLELRKDLGLTAPARRHAAAAVLAASCTITGMCAYWETSLRWPSRQLTKSADHPPAGADIVFVEGYDWIPPWRLNFNKPGSKIVFVNDPGPSQRAALAKMAGRPNWLCLYYDPEKKTAAWSKIDDNRPSRSGEDRLITSGSGIQ